MQPFHFEKNCHFDIVPDPIIYQVLIDRGKQLLVFQLRHALISQNYFSFQNGNFSHFEITVAILLRIIFRQHNFSDRLIACVLEMSATHILLSGTHFVLSLS